MIIVDAHLDLMWNILTFGRDYSLSAAELRQREIGTQVPTLNGDAMVGWPDMQRGQVAIVFSTLFAAPIRRKTGDWDSLHYADIPQARQLYGAQMDQHHRLVEQHPDKFRLLLNRADLSAHLEHWREAAQPSHPVGMVMLMEGAEAIGHPQELEQWWQGGLRIIGPAWAGTRFCGGTREPGPLTADGYALLEAMAEMGFILDISHMDEKAALQALEVYPGRVLASHSNAQALLKNSETNRHLADHVLRALFARGGVVGILPMAPFLLAGWQRGDRRDLVSLKRAADQIDYACQMAGNATQVGVGSDFDGGFGLQSAPAEIDTIADLQKIIPLLAEKGYTEADIAAIMGQNWINLLLQALP